MKFFNVHKHTSPDLRGAGEIINIYSSFDQIPQHGFYSAGLHPWYLDSDTVKVEWELLQKVGRNENILAIGECGLDKVCKTDWKLQEEWFVKQLELANLMSKPLIIHCVRAFDEVLLMLKESMVSVPIVFHGFNKSIELARKIQAEGYYLSFGMHLIDNSSVREVFAQTPTDKLFLETDAAEIEIEGIYRVAAVLKGIDLTDLAAQIEKNIIKVFGEKMIIDDE